MPSIRKIEEMGIADKTRKIESAKIIEDDPILDSRDKDQENNIN